MLADYAAHQEYVRVAREIQSVKTEYMLRKMAITGTLISYVVVVVIIVECCKTMYNNNNNDISLC